MASIATPGIQPPIVSPGPGYDLTRMLVGDVSKYVHLICEARAFHVERTKLEPHTAGINFLDVGVFEIRNKQAWVIQLLLDIVCGPGHEDVGSNWRAADREAFSGLENVSNRDTFSGLEYATCLKAHAHLFAMASRLGMYELRDYACKMFKIDVQNQNTQSRVMCDAVVAVYTEIEGTLLKEIIIDAWLMGGKQLARAAGKDGFIRLMALVPEFVADLHARVMMGFKSVDSLDCFRYLCKNCGLGSRGSFDGEVGRPCCSQCGSTSTRYDFVAKVRLNHLPVAEKRKE